MSNGKLDQKKAKKSSIWAVLQWHVVNKENVGPNTSAESWDVKNFNLIGRGKKQQDAPLYPSSHDY